MAAHRSGRALPVVALTLVLAATLASCDRGTDAPRTTTGRPPSLRPGNVGIAAHRDGYFRVLKDIKEGDALVLDTPVATEHFRVQWIKITTPDDVSVIDPTPTSAVTLVGCYPFYHVGAAPKRFIVRAVPAAGSPSGS